MAEIVKFPGGKKEQPRSELAERGGDERLTLMLRFLTTLAKSDPSWVNRQNKDLRQEGLEKSKDEELWSMVNKSDEVQWKEKPSFYSALVFELKKRGLIGKKPPEE